MMETIIDLNNNEIRQESDSNGWRPNIINLSYCDLCEQSTVTEYETVTNAPIFDQLYHLKCVFCGYVKESVVGPDEVIES